MRVSIYKVEVIKNKHLMVSFRVALSEESVFDGNN